MVPGPSWSLAPLGPWPLFVPGPSWSLAPLGPWPLLVPGPSWSLAPLYYVQETLPPPPLQSEQEVASPTANLTAAASYDDILRLLRMPAPR